MTTEPITLASIHTDIGKLISQSKAKMEELKEEDFANPLDFIHTKAKLQGYLERMDEAKVLLGKSKEIEEFSLLLKKEIDVQTPGYADVRMQILNKEEDENDLTPPEDIMHDRGLVNGRILAITHLGVLINTADNTLAKELAIKLGKDKPVGN